MAQVYVDPWQGISPWKGVKIQHAPMVLLPLGFYPLNSILSPLLHHIPPCHTAPCSPPPCSHPCSLGMEHTAFSMYCSFCQHMQASTGLPTTTGNCYAGINKAIWKTLGKKINIFPISQFCTYVSGVAGSFCTQGP